MLPRSNFQSRLCAPNPLGQSLIPSRAVCSAQFQPAKRISKPIDESSWASAQHKPSLGNASFGHLISELSATRPGMEALRREGHTMDENDRTQARKVATWVMGVPVLIGSGVIGMQLWRIWGERAGGEGSEAWARA